MKSLKEMMSGKMPIKEMMMRGKMPLKPMMDEKAVSKKKNKTKKRK